MAYKRKTIDLWKHQAIVILALIAGVLIGALLRNVAIAQEPISPLGEPVKIIKERIPEEKPKTVEEIIEDRFGEYAEQAVQVAFCESSLNPKAKSKLSSAKGLFQIIDGTWAGYRCQGDPHNPYDNAKCAKMIFDRNGWGSTASWKASQGCHGFQ